MNLYKINEEIAQVLEEAVDPETGEFIATEELIERLDRLSEEKESLLGYLAKLVLNTRSDTRSLKEEEVRLKERRERLERKEKKLLDVLDRECAGEKTDFGVATLSYRRSESVDIYDEEAAREWLKGNPAGEACLKEIPPTILKSEIKSLIKEGLAVPGTRLKEERHCSLK